VTEAVGNKEIGLKRAQLKRMHYAIYGINVLFGDIRDQARRHFPDIRQDLDSIVPLVFDLKSKIDLMRKELKEMDEQREREDSDD
jgi:hypothetical protein